MTRTQMLGIGLTALTVLAMSPAALAGSVTGSGRVMYYENGTDGGAYLPLTGARVKLMDDDGWVGDDELRSGYVGTDGRFTLSGSDDDGWFGGRLDPYIEVELESAGGKVVVESEILKLNVTCATPVRNETEGNINFGTFHCSSDDGKNASAIFGAMVKQYNNFTRLSGQSAVPLHNGKAAVLFPSTFTAGVPFTTEESIHWPGGYKRFGAVYHEFGHRIRHGQDGDFGHFMYDVARFSYMQHHNAAMKTNFGFAFNEGWAEYHASLLDSSEASRFANWNLAANNGGSLEVEGNVAAKLYKLSEKCGGFNRMWSNLKKGNIHSYSEFESKLKADFQANAALRNAYPQCLPTINNTPLLTLIPLSTGVLVNPAVLRTAPMSGAPAEVLAHDLRTQVSVAQQTTALRNASAFMVGQTRTLSFRPKVGAFTNLRGFAQLWGTKRVNFERTSALKFDTYVKALRPIQATREAMQQRMAQHKTFLKGVVQDRANSIAELIRMATAEKAKAGNSPQAQGLQKLLNKANRLLAELNRAATSGVIKNQHLPKMYRLSTEVKN